MTPPLLVYDLEIVRAIQGNPKEPRQEGVEYCAGWHDHANMGISCLCAHDYVEDRYRVFFEDNLGDFVKLARERTLAGFNSIAFDDAVVKAYARTMVGNIQPLALDMLATSYDLLVETWKAAGLPGTFQSAETHGNFGLAKLAHANLGVGKSGSGALAPVLWQRGQRGAVVDYCLHDVWLTKRLIDRVIAWQGDLRDPRDPSRVLRVKVPE